MLDTKHRVTQLFYDTLLSNYMSVFLRHPATSSANNVVEASAWSDWGAQL